MALSGGIPTTALGLIETKGLVRMSVIEAATNSALNRFFRILSS